MRKLARRHQLLQRALWRLDFILVWGVVKLARLLPIDAASRFGNRVGTFIGPRLKAKSAKYRLNMATVLPALDDTALDLLVRRAWGRAGQILAEFPHMDTILHDRERLLIDIREPVAAYEDHDLPCIIVTAHQSNWEVVGAAMARMGIPNTTLYSPPTNPLLDEMLLASRRVLNCTLVPRDNGARMLLRSLKQGHAAAMVMDRRVEDGKLIQFFGHDKLSTILPAKLALTLGCDLIPVQVERLRDARYRVTFHSPVRPSDATENATNQAIDMIQQVHGQFETWIRAHPEDWFCPKLVWQKAS